MPACDQCYCGLQCRLIASACGVTGLSGTPSVRVQCMYRCWKARAVVRAAVAVVYKKMFDVSSGYPYYFNAVTGASTWTKPLPRLFGDSDLEMTPRTLAAVLQAYPPTTARLTDATTAIVATASPTRTPVIPRTPKEAACVIQVLPRGVHVY